MASAKSLVYNPRTFSSRKSATSDLSLAILSILQKESYACASSLHGGCLLSVPMN